MITNTHLSGLCWFRRDLRLDDHAALFHALASSDIVHCAFVFDRKILDQLPSDDRRVAFIWLSISELDAAIRDRGGCLHVLYGDAQEEIPRLAKLLEVDAVFCNRDYEPAAIERDLGVRLALQADGIAFYDYKDQVIFDRDEILTASGQPYSVFTPYKNAWLKRFRAEDVAPYTVEKYFDRLARHCASQIPSLSSMGFDEMTVHELRQSPGMSGASQLANDFANRLWDYHLCRDYPAIKGVSYLSAHLRFGAISIRQVARLALMDDGKGGQTFLSELIWRDFYQMVLFHRPDIAAGRAFKPKFENLPFENDRHKFAAWCGGNTGFPIVDAAMRQLNATGYMHNRLRMVAASFLVKDLHVDWRWGEGYFSRKLLDFDFSANNGGWQWAASTGCDAQPWFRIFNPENQSRKFDPDGKFIRKYIPELANCPDKWVHAPWRMPTEDLDALGIKYGKPIVDHAVARLRTLEIFKQAST